MANPGNSASSRAGSRGGIRTLRMPQIRHMKELINYGATSNRRFRIVRK